jgi:hypothetical protein
VIESRCSRAIREAVLAFERHDPGSWCRPLVDALESLGAGRSIDWCVDVLKQTCGRDAPVEDRGTLEELRPLVDRNSSGSVIHQKSREIWYRTDARSDFQTATSKAYEAVAAYLNGDVERYKRGIAFIISEIALGPLTSSSDQRMQNVLGMFNCRCEQLEAGSRGKNEDD